MGGFIGVVAVVLTLAYIGWAVWFICKRRTIGGSIGASAGLLCGGIVAIPIIDAVAAFICWSVAVIIALAVVKVIFSR